MTYIFGICCSSSLVRACTSAASSSHCWQTLPNQWAPANTWGQGRGAAEGKDETRRHLWMLWGGEKADIEWGGEAGECCLFYSGEDTLLGGQDVLPQCYPALHLGSERAGAEVNRWVPSTQEQVTPIHQPPCARLCVSLFWLAEPNTTHWAASDTEICLWGRSAVVQ